jgi:hypothetical protein
MELLPLYFSSQFLYHKIYIKKGDFIVPDKINEVLSLSLQESFCIGIHENVLDTNDHPQEEESVKKPTEKATPNLL